MGHIFQAFVSGFIIMLPMIYLNGQPITQLLFSIRGVYAWVHGFKKLDSPKLQQTEFFIS